MSEEAKVKRYLVAPLRQGVVLASDFDALARQLEEARAELTRWATWGTIEVAIRNPNVASYIEHLEKRALSAEAERDQREAECERWAKENADLAKSIASSNPHNDERSAIINRGEK